MEIFGIEKFSMVDYEGRVACVLFTEQCNFRCPFCHNAPLILGGARREAVKESEIFDYLEKRKNVVDGVVISGGEPTLHGDLPEYIQKIKALGYKIKLDSNGTRPEVIKKLVNENLIDYVAMDIKSSRKGYPLATGLEKVDVGKIGESAAFLISGVVDYEFRTTLVNELHEKADFEDIAEWLCGAKRYFLQKFVGSDTCVCDGLSEVDKETALEYKAILCKTVKSVALRGY